MVSRKDYLRRVEPDDAEFLKALEDGETPAPGFGEAVKAHEIVEAAYESARNGSSVKLSG